MVAVEDSGYVADVGGQARRHIARAFSFEAVGVRVAGELARILEQCIPRDHGAHGTSGKYPFVETPRNSVMYDSSVARAKLVPR